MATRNKKERQLTQQEFSVMAAFRQGPLPPPVELEKYESLYPGVTKLLFDNFVRQSEHRMKLETTVVTGDNRRANRGQIISAIMAFLCIGAGSALTFLGKNVEGLALIFGSMGSILVAFYGGAVLRKMERIQKNKEQP